MFRMLPTAQSFLLLSRHSWAQTETAEYTTELKKINHSCWLDNWREGSCIQLIKGRIKQLCEVSWVLVSFLQTDSQLLAQCGCIWEHGIVWNLNTHTDTRICDLKRPTHSLFLVYISFNMSSRNNSFSLYQARPFAVQLTGLVDCANSTLSCKAPHHMDIVSGFLLIL